MLTKIAFVSILTNIEQYCDLAITTITSYILTNSTKIDWVILYNDNLEKIEQRLKYLQCDLVNLKFIKLYNVNFELHDANSISITRDYCYKNFISRIFNINSLKEEYDLVCPCDLDILFIKDLKDKFDNIDFEYQMIGCLEKSDYTETTLSMKEKKQCTPFLNKDFYINFGFAILISKNIDVDLVSLLLKFNNENKLKYFVTQEQSFFAQVLDKILVDNTLQLFMWNRHMFPIQIPTYYIVHFSVQQFLLEKININDINIFSHKHVMIIFYINLYKNIINKCKNLSSEFIDRINYNCNVISKIKEKYPIMVEYMQKFYNLPNIPCA